MSLGFTIATRMLQKYPELTKKVDFLVSVVGFSHKSDLKLTKKQVGTFTVLSRIISRKWPARFFRYTALSPFVLRKAYHRTFKAKEKFSAVSGDEFRRTMDMEIHLWHINDVRTHFRTYVEMFKLDNTKKTVDLPVYHVATKNDRYFDDIKVEQHMRRVFKDFTIFYSKAPNHAPTVVATAKEAAPFIPPELKRLLNQKN
jgi:pimeloyl-ACP methyl ester carboxylesterase